MGRAGRWFMLRTGFVETFRATVMAAREAAAAVRAGEWPSFAVVEVDQQLVEDAARLPLECDLRSLDALHLAAAMILPREDLVLATWNRGCAMRPSGRAWRCCPKGSGPEAQTTVCRPCESSAQRESRAKPRQPPEP